MTFDLTFFALAIPAVVFAGISKGGFGSGAAFAATPILALILTPGQALGLMLPLLMVMDISTLRPYWRRWDSAAARLLILGAVPGIALAAALYHLTNPDVFRLLIGALALGFVAFQLAGRSGLLKLSRRPVGPLYGLVSGSIAGFTSFVSNAGGPPAAIYLLRRGIGKTTYQATTVLVFWVVNILKFLPFLYLGIFSRDTVTADILLAPFAVLGAWLGVKAHHRVPERAFFALTYILLACTGAKLIWDALA
ncbi:sulfite exporter TauE/SafE family protein [Acidimangrovimonas pyrenivorans]|uniref:Probable membrane transporter protein n=1 Tax=Acidimangrovimonas pyrenivorans TaxID=2030798 RepID=A0ABV7AM54_9RHOB